MQTNFEGKDAFLQTWANGSGLEKAIPLKAIWFFFSLHFLFLSLFLVGFLPTCLCSFWKGSHQDVKQNEMRTKGSHVNDYGREKEILLWLWLGKFVCSVMHALLQVSAVYELIISDNFRHKISWCHKWYKDYVHPRPVLWVNIYQRIMWEHTGTKALIASLWCQHGAIRICHVKGIWSTNKRLIKFIGYFQMVVISR